MNSGCAIYHHYDPYYGQLVDAETKQPLEGAVVLAHYVTYQHLSPGGPVPHFLDTQEVVSDKKGEFAIPALNAFSFRAFSTFKPDPYFMIFKPKYNCAENAAVSENKYDVIELRELKTREERIANHCFPTSVPKNRMIKFIEMVNMEEIDLGFTPYTIRK